MQLEPIWLFMILFAFIMVMASIVFITYILYKMSLLRYAKAEMEQRMLKVESILEEKRI